MALHRRSRIVAITVVRAELGAAVLAPYLEGILCHFHVNKLSLRELMFQLSHLLQELLLGLWSLSSRFNGSDRNAQFSQLPNLIRSNHIPRDSQTSALQLLSDTLSHLRIRNHSHCLSPA